MTEIQSLATEVLGHLKTGSPKAIDRMIQQVTSYNYQEADRAKAALVEIGKPAVQPLIKKLQATTEQDPDKLLVLIAEINRLLEEKDQRLRPGRNDGGGADR